MSDPEQQVDILNLLEPLRYQGRVEPDHFDPRVHCAGVLDWIAAGGEDPTEFAASLDTFIGDRGFKPLTEFSEQYVPPPTYDEIDRFAAATAFLVSQGMSRELIDQLSREMLAALRESSMSDDARITQAVISAEALARGEYDPFTLIFSGEIMQADDF